MNVRKLTSLLLALTLLLAVFGVGCASGAPEDTQPAQTTLPSEAPEETTEAPTETTTEPEQVSRMPSRMEIPESDTSLSQEGVQPPANAPLVSMAADTLAPNPIKGVNAEPVDPYRPHYDVGTAGQLEGDPFFLCIFLDDNESRWTDSELQAFLQDKFHPGIDWLCQQASYWGVHLEYTAGYYCTDSTVTCRYNGLVGDFNGNLNNDILEQAAASLGFTSKEEMHLSMQEWSGKEQVAYVVIANKEGRSYAMMDWYNDGYDVMEYCVLFAKPSYVGDLVYDCPPATVAHEVLHLFGAEDYYAEGTQNVQRSQLASSYFYNDLMLNIYYDISYNTVGAYTAYTVGWTDTTPAVCYNDGWWD